MKISNNTVLLNIVLIFLNFKSFSAVNIQTSNSDDNHLFRLSDLENNVTISPLIEIKSNIFQLIKLKLLKQWKRRRRYENYTRNEVTFVRHKKIPIDVDFIHSKWINFQGTSVPVSVETYPERTLVTSKFMKEWPLNLWRRYFFKDEYIKEINFHWLNFSPPNPLVNYIAGGFYIILMIVGCSGNAIVLLMYMRCRTLRTPGNILVANLALSDFMMLAKTPVFIFNSFNQGPALGQIGCEIYGFIGGLTGCTSIATLAGIALDRYWAVVRPLEPLRALTAVRARLLAIGAWIYAAVFASIPALDLGYGRYVPEGYLTSCSFDYLTDEPKPRYFIFVFFCAAWVAPFCTISFCYIKILRVVVCNRNVSSINDHRLSTRHVKEQVKRKAEIKLAVLVVAVIALFFVSWTPYAIVALLGIFGRKDLITPTVSIIPALFCKTAACINPFIYIITHPKFRVEIKKLLFKKKKSRHGTTKTSAYTENQTYQKAYNKDSSDTDVEVVEMKDIPFQKEKTKKKVKTVSAKVSEKDDVSISLKSFDGEGITPPSWFAKPQFSKKRSFHRQSSKSIVSYNTDPTFI